MWEKLKKGCGWFKNRYGTWEGRGLLAGLGVGTIASVIIIAILGIAGSPFTGGASGAAAIASILYILGTAASCGAAFKYFGKGVDAIVEIRTSQNKNTSNSKLATLIGAIAGIIFAIVMLITSIVSGPLGAVAAFLHQAAILFKALIYPIIVIGVAHFCGSAAEKLGAALDPHYSKEQRETPGFVPEPDKAYGVVFVRWLIKKISPAKNNAIDMETPAQPLLASENTNSPTPKPALTRSNSQKNILTQIKAPTNTNAGQDWQQVALNKMDRPTAESTIKPLSFLKSAASMLCGFFASPAQNAEGGNYTEQPTFK